MGILLKAFMPWFGGAPNLRFQPTVLRLRPYNGASDIRVTTTWWVNSLSLGVASGALHSDSQFARTQREMKENGEERDAKKKMLYVELPMAGHGKRQ